MKPFLADPEGTFILIVIPLDEPSSEYMELELEFLSAIIAVKRL